MSPLCMLCLSVPVCEHSQNSNGGTLEEVLSRTGPVCCCIQNEFIVDSPCCCSEHTLATNEENDSIFLNDFSWRRLLANTIKNNFHLLFFCHFFYTFFFSPYKIINILCFTFSIFVQNSKLYKSSETKNNSGNGKQKKLNLCTEIREEAQRVPTRPSDTDMHPDNTMFPNNGQVPTLCKSKTKLSCESKCDRGTKSCSNCCDGHWHSKQKKRFFFFIYIFFKDVFSISHVEGLHSAPVAYYQVWFKNMFKRKVTLSRINPRSI